MCLSVGKNSFALFFVAFSALARHAILAFGPLCALPFSNWIFSHFFRDAPKPCNRIRRAGEGSEACTMMSSEPLEHPFEVGRES